MSAELQAALRQRTTVASSRDAAIDAIVSALDIYGENVAALACDFFDETMEMAGYSGLSAQMPSGIFSREEIERIAHYQATKLTDGNSEGFVEQVSTDASNLVYQTNIRTMLFQAGMGVNGNDVSLPSNDQTAYVAHASPHADYEVRYQRIPQGIETCDFCLMLASRGAVYLSHEGAMGHSEYDPGHVHRGCVVAGTKVSGTGLLAGFERQYEGPLVHLTTAGGHDLTVTPNHPILTDLGWVRADALKEGDNLVCATGVDSDVRGVPDDDYAPPSVEDVVVACRLAHATLANGMPPTAVNLDGSPIDGEVDVVSPDGFLASGGDPALYEEFVQSGLAAAHLLATDGGVELDRAGAERPLLLGADAPLGGGMGVGYLSGTLLGGHLGGTHLASLGASALFDTGPVEPAVDDVAGDAESARNRVDALATLERFHDAIRHRDSMLVGLDTTTPERLVDGAVGDAELLCNGIGLDAGLIELDQLVGLEIIEGASCHVYNLHTQDSMYVANGIITHNCDCIVVAVPCHSEGGQLVADVTFDDYDTDQMYELWGEWKSVTKKYSGKGSGTAEMRERMKQEKLDLMERRLGRREW